MCQPHYIRLPVSYTTDAAFEAKLKFRRFPESYKDGLRQLHAQYPNWIFKAKKTGLDWSTVIENEALLGRNLVSSGSISSWKSVESGAITGITVPGPALTAATGSQRQRILYATIWIPEIS